jgi:hypothetical protein
MSPPDRPTVRAEKGDAVLGWAARLAPLGVAAALGWSYGQSFRHPTFFGDQGARLDRAAELVVGVGQRHWLPFLQLQIHLLYRLHAPAWAFLLIPYGYTVASLFLLAWLCRAALPGPREALPATALLLVGFAGSSFHWLGRSLYQEAIVIPVFLALVGLHFFAPRRRAAFVALLAIGMLTREVFWIWWLAYLALEWRGRLRDAALRAGLLALGAIPLVWLLATRQGLLLARNSPPAPLTLAALAGRAAALGRTLGSEWLLPALLSLAAVFVLAAARRGVRSLSFRSFHVFSGVSLAAIYGYLLLTDPWHNTPGNTRALVPLFAHVLFWTILGWRDASRLGGRAGPAARALAAVAMLSLLKLPAIAAALGGKPPASHAGAWEPLRLPGIGGPAARDWRADLEAALEPLRARRRGPLRVAFVGVPRGEYLKFWVAAFLYDERRVVGGGGPPPPVDAIVAPEGFAAPGFARRARLRVSSDATRDLLVPTAPAEPEPPAS